MGLLLHIPAAHSLHQQHCDAHRQLRLPFPNNSTVPTAAAAMRSQAVVVGEIDDEPHLPPQRRLALQQQRHRQRVARRLGQAPVV